MLEEETYQQQTRHSNILLLGKWGEYTRNIRLEIGAFRHHFVERLAMIFYSRDNPYNLFLFVFFNVRDTIDAFLVRKLSNNDAVCFLLVIRHSSLFIIITIIESINKSYRTDNFFSEIMTSLANYFFCL